MKTKLPFVFFLATTAILFSNFMVREKEEIINSSNGYSLSEGDKCFATFILKLQKMDALIFIPKGKISDAQSLNLSLVSADKARTLNKNFADARNTYIQVYPSDNQRDDCSKVVSLSFKNLGMVCFVRTEKTAELKNQLMYKLEPGNVYYKLETAKINAFKPDELQLKLNMTSPEWKDYVSVKY